MFLFLGSKAQQMLRGGKPCAEDAQGDDEAEHQRNFAEMEETPADIESVGFEDGIDQRTHGGKQPAAQSQADGGGEDTLPHGLIKEGAADERCGRAEQLGDFDFFFAA